MNSAKSVSSAIARPLFAGILSLAVGVAHATGVWVVESRVVGVSDGDTITVLDPEKKQHKIRISGIDAPEKGSSVRRTIATKPCPDGARKGCPDRVSQDGSFRA